jgi:hypothetical protein
MLKRLAVMIAVPILSMIGITTAAVGHENSAPIANPVAVHYTVQQGGDSACGRSPSGGLVNCCGQGRYAC